jgi:hypothetical protein
MIRRAIRLGNCPASRPIPIFGARGGGVKSLFRILVTMTKNFLSWMLGLRTAAPCPLGSLPRIRTPQSMKLAFRAMQEVSGICTKKVWCEFRSKPTPHSV